MELFTNFNGEIIRENQVNLSPYNRSFRYGDGCFETMKMINGKLLLSDYHFERLVFSHQTLKLEIPTYFNSHYLVNAITSLAELNNHSDLARVRLTMYRRGENFKEINNETGFIIQTEKGDFATNYFNETGLEVGIFTDAKKNFDNFSPIKSNNYLPYAMAKIWASENNFDDALIMNSFSGIAEASTANIFLIEDGIIKTPPLLEGCVSGVMRRYLIKCFKEQNLNFQEENLNIDQLYNASEVFLTNAIIGIRWVKRIKDFEFNNTVSKRLHENYIAPLFLPQTI